MDQTATPYLEKRIAKSFIPQVTIVAALRPSADSRAAGSLRYPSLEAAAKRHLPFKEARAQRLVTVTPGSLDEDRVKAELLKQELLECAWSLQRYLDPASQQRWSERFTKASLALFGAPSHGKVRALIKDSLRKLATLSSRPGVDPVRLARVRNFYKHHFGNGQAQTKSAVDAEAQFHGIALETRHYFHKHFGHALEAVVNGDPLNLIVDPHGMVARFERGLDALQANQLMWRGWQVVMHDSGSLSVKCAAHRILVGERREPMLLSALPGKFAHEVLVHVLRQLNAKRLDDPKLTKGLAGYTDAEEGLACFVEYAVNGLAPREAVERYVDIAFALGLLDGRPVARRELFQVALDRKMVTAQAAGKRLTEAKIAPAIWEHVNRIYRGTRGEQTVGVFTKDVSYYDGFQAVGEYLLHESKERPVAEVLGYLLSCKFDPFDKTHADYVAKVLAGRGF